VSECCDLSKKLTIPLHHITRSGVRVDLPPLPLPAFIAWSLHAGTTTYAFNPIECSSKQFITRCQHVTTLIVGKGRDCSDLGSIRTNYYGENIYMLEDAGFIGSVSTDLASNCGTSFIVRKRKILFITNITKFEAMNMNVT
jgi:hypothetical protein